MYFFGGEQSALDFSLIADGCKFAQDRAEEEGNAKERTIWSAGDDLIDDSGFKLSASIDQEGLNQPISQLSIACPD